MENRLVELLDQAKSVLEGIGGKGSLDKELSYYDSENLRLQFPSIDDLAIRLLDSWWNTSRKQMLMRRRFQYLESALHEQGAHNLASMSVSEFNNWLIHVFGITTSELDEKLTWQQFIDKGAAWACLNFITQFSGPDRFYEWIAHEIGVGSWNLARGKWQDYVGFAWLLAHRIAYKMPIPNTDSVGILGIGTVLMCDYLKEIGVELYGKPDSQVKNVFRQLGLVGIGSEDEDWKTFRLLWQIAALTEHTPAVVDKILWMTSSGRWDKTLDRGLYSEPPILTGQEAKRCRKERSRKFDEILENLIKNDG